MNINNEIELVNIGNKDELLKYYDGIAELFNDSFGKPLNLDLWRWAYMDNPFGEPLVAVAICQGRVIGHYAVVPMELDNKASKLAGFLSMTTMVAVDFRMHKLFQRLAEMVYERVEALAVPAMVFGFPNDNSAPGFVKRLGWKISEDFKVVSIKPSQVKALITYLKKLKTNDCYTLNLEQKAIKVWRTAKPGQEWVYESGYGLKKAGVELDLMHISNIENFEKNEVKVPFNMILPVSEELLIDDLEVSFPYRFGYRLFNTETDPTLFVQMSMSDIF